jgi:hypothetical protein
MRTSRNSASDDWDSDCFGTFGVQMGDLEWLFGNFGVHGWQHMADHGGYNMHTYVLAIL